MVAVVVVVVAVVVSNIPQENSSAIFPRNIPQESPIQGLRVMMKNPQLVSEYAGRGRDRDRDRGRGRGRVVVVVWLWL